ncbi:hypothetical protein OPIT5_10660 [Opitutaceae bacterium TAV5]|nr:hypothetical protein OPIT5_10660 [Opitutaceae bacterium TAV5]
MGEEVFAQFGREAAHEGGRGMDQRFVLAGASAAHIAFEFGKGLFDGVEVRAVSGQVA